jgi:hypothetical protein
MFNLLTTGGVGVLTGLFKFVLGKWLDSKREEKRHLYSMAGAQLEDRKRAADIKDDKVSFTRRMIAFALTITVCLPGIIACFNPDFVMNVPVPSKSEGFNFFFISFGAQESLDYMRITGYTYLLALVDFYGFIIGYYFGSGGSRSR